MGKELFEEFNHGKLCLPERVSEFSTIKWSKHTMFHGVELKHIVTSIDTGGLFSCLFTINQPDITYYYISGFMKIIFMDKIYRYTVAKIKST